MIHDNFPCKCAIVIYHTFPSLRFNECADIHKDIRKKRAINLELGKPTQFRKNTSTDNSKLKKD